MLRDNRVGSGSKKMGEGEGVGLCENLEGCMYWMLVGFLLRCLADRIYIQRFGKLPKRVGVSVLGAVINRAPRVEGCGERLDEAGFGQGAEGLTPEVIGAVTGWENLRLGYCGIGWGSWFGSYVERREKF